MCASPWSDTRKRPSHLAGSSFLLSSPCLAPSSWRWGTFHSVIHLSVNRAPTLEDSALSKRHLESTWGAQISMWNLEEKPGVRRHEMQPVLTPKSHRTYVSDFTLSSLSLICKACFVEPWGLQTFLEFPQTFDLNCIKIFFQLYKKRTIKYYLCQILTHWRLPVCSL